MSKRFYLQDEELHSRDDDFFRHEDLAANIEHIIKENVAPYNIAVIGKWGLGKSSLINMALTGIKNKGDEYLCVYINAWKYEKEVLSRVFLKQVMSSLQPEAENEQEKAKKSIFKSLKEILRNNTAENSGFKENLKLFLRRYRGWIAVYVIASFAVYALYRIMMFYINPVDPAPGSCWYYICSIAAGYLRNSATMLLAPAFLFLLTNVAFDFKTNPLHRVGFQLPEMKVEDYESELGKVIDKKRRDNPNFKIVITLDDLDRLSSDKMVEALDAIKMFINFRNCIFIVPFDDTILKKAIEDNRFSDRKDIVIMEGEQYLDKLFQYKIYLLPQLDYDIKKYARTLCANNLKDFLVEYCDEKTFMKALDRIIIHFDVTTPRQVKKLVNTFISYMMLAHRREKEGKVPGGFSTKEDGIFTIAKLSVLQADFNEFYDLLFDDPDLMDRVLEYQRTMKVKQTDSDTDQRVELSEKVQRAVGIDKNGEFTEKSRALLDFLHSTRNYGKDNLSTYLYVTEDDIAQATGAKDQRDFIKAASSGNTEECLQMLHRNPVLILAAEEFIKRSNDDVAISGILYAVTVAFEAVSDEYRRGIADAVADRAEDIVESWEIYGHSDIVPEGLLALYSSSQSQPSFEVLIDYLLENEPESKTAEDIICAYLDVKDLLPDATINKLHGFIHKAINTKAVKYRAFIPIRQGYGLNSEVWMDDYYKLLIAEANEQEDYSSETFAELRKIYYIEKKKDIKKAFAELKGLFEKSWALELLIEFIENDRDSLSNALICDLIKQQIALDDKDSENINKLLTAYEYKLAKEEDYADLDLYLQDQVHKEEIKDLLDVFGKKNAIKNIPETVNELINLAFTDKEDIHIESVIRIIKLDDGTYLPSIKQKITAALNINLADYTGMSEIMSAYIEVKSEDMQTAVNTAITQMNNNTSPRPKVSVGFYDMMAEYLDNVKADSDFASCSDAFIKGVIKRIGENLNVDEGLDTLIKLSDMVSDEDFVSVEPRLYKLASEADKLKKVYVLFEKKKHIFGSKDGQPKNSDLVDVCLDAIEKTTLKNEAIQTLGNKYNFIGEELRFYELIQGEGIDRKSAYSVCRKFITKKIQSDGNAVDAVHDICTVLNRDGLECLEDILENPEDILIRAVDIILNQKDSFAYDEFRCITEWILSHISDENANKYVDEMVGILSEEVDNKDLAADIVDLVEKIPDGIFSKKREKYIPIFVRLVMKGFGEAFNERLMVLAQSRHISDIVIAQAPDSMSRELNGYIKKKKGFWTKKEGEDDEA